MQNTARSIDKNGFLTIKGCPISSFGIFKYSAGQVGLEGDPNRIVNVYRPESAVNNKEAIETFKNVPFIDDHEMLSGFDDDESTAPEDYGVDGVLTSEVYYKDGWMRGDLKVFSRKLRKAIDSGKVDLSLGYGCDFIIQSGEFEGQPYEVIQTNLRGNHIALVDVGRVAGARVLDGRCFDHLCLLVRPSNEDSSMEKANQGTAAVKVKQGTAADNAVEQLKSLLPALEQFLTEESSEPAHQGDEVPETGGEESTNNEQPVDASSPAGESEPANEAAPSAPPSAGTETEPATEPAAQAEGGVNLADLISKVEAICAQLKQAAGGGAQDEEPSMDGEETEVGQAADVVTGLQESSHRGASVEKDDEPTKNPKASPGPKAGENTMAADSALRAFYADSARKDSIYKRVSQITGSFDHSAMDSKAVAQYAAKKLGIKCADGAEYDSVENYLRGVEAAQKAVKTHTQKVAQDAAEATSELDAFLRGE